MNVQDAINLAKQARRLSTEDYIRSLLIAFEMGTVWGRCYQNAYPTFFAYPTLFDPDGLFVEGWIVYEDSHRIILMEHGWLVSGKRIVDPTIVHGIEFGQPVHYVPGVCRARPELEALENEFFPHVRFENYGDDGMGHPDYRAAYEAAHTLAQSLLTEDKTFIEVRATMLEAENEKPSFRVIFLSENGGGHGKERL